MNATTTPKVLVADDDASIRLVLSQALTRAGYEVRATGAASTLAKWAIEGEGDLIVTDVLMPDENVFDVLPRIRRARPSLPIIVMSAQNTLLTAVAAAERGAFEYLPKPFDLDTLVATARRALAPAGRAPRAARPPRDERSPLVGRSPAMQAVYRTLARLVAVDLPVLIVGEPGSGKALTARALHELGPRRDARFVSVRLAGLGPERAEADVLAAGAAAAGGTLHLAEPAGLSREAQARVTAALDALAPPEDGRRSAAPRIVATTSEDLRRMVADDQFGRDLLDRLDVARLPLPPLRDRGDDVAELARHVLARTGASDPPRAFAEAAIDRLRAHAWPGNVRELENVVRRVAALHPATVLGPETVEAEISAQATPVAEGARAPLDAHLERAVAEAFAGGAPEPGLHDRMIGALERPLMRAALQASGGAQIRAAELLGLNRNTLRKRLGELGIKARD